MKVPEGEEKKYKAKVIYEEIMAEKSPNLLKDINLHIEEVQWTSNRIN